MSTGDWKIKTPHPGAPPGFPFAILNWQDKVIAWGSNKKSAKAILKDFARINEFDDGFIQNRIQKVARSKRRLSKADAFAVSFHMTDWLGAFKDYQRFCSNPQFMSDNELDDLLAQFLIHAPDHLAAAKKLYTGWPVTDVFEVGAVEEKKTITKDEKHQ